MLYFQVQRVVEELTLKTIEETVMELMEEENTMST